MGVFDERLGERADGTNQVPTRKCEVIYDITNMAAGLRIPGTLQMAAAADLEDLKPS